MEERWRRQGFSTLRFNGCYFLSCLFLLILFNYLTNTYILASAFGRNHSKFFWIPFVVGMMFLIHRVFKWKSDAILRRYRDRKILDAKHILLVLAIVIGPLLSDSTFE